jgi:hypothetical protein
MARNTGSATATAPPGISDSGRTLPAYQFRPGERLKADGFPENAIAASALRRGNEGYGTNHRANIARAVADAQKAAPGIELKKVSAKRGQSVAHVTSSVLPSTGQVTRQSLTINTAAEFWKNPRAEGIRARRSGFSASASPAYVMRHEIGHIKHKPVAALRWASTPASAGRVSRYAKTDAMEFMAEVRGGRASGQRYPARVMRDYRRLAAAAKGAGERNFRPRRINPVALS